MRLLYAYIHVIINTALARDFYHRLRICFTRRENRYNLKTFGTTPIRIFFGVPVANSRSGVSFSEYDEFLKNGFLCVKLCCGRQGLTRMSSEGFPHFYNISQDQEPTFFFSRNLFNFNFTFDFLFLVFHLFIKRYWVIQLRKKIIIITTHYTMLR